jgi:2-haloacid dehalogenase
MSHICVFDVNETLLDLQALDPLFDRMFGDAALRKAWFSQMLQCALVATITNVYSDFGTTGIAALEMIAARQEVKLTAADRQLIRSGMQQLPPHPEVVESLTMLRQAGLRLTALTNSTQAVAEAQLTHAGLRDYFEQVFSADTVKRLKPAPEPYQMVARQLGVPISNLRLIAAHSWDVAGALRAGCAAAFIARPGMVLDPLVEQPDIVGNNLREVAIAILQHEVPASHDISSPTEEEGGE